MIVCLCKGVRLKTVQQTICAGAATIPQVGRQCGAGTDCGACHELIKTIIDKEAAYSSWEEKEYEGASQQGY